MNVGRYKWVLFVLGLAVIAGALAVQRFRHNDTRTLTGFFGSYDNFDQAIADFAAGDGPHEEGAASDAFTKLNKNASAFRLSSFVEHDADLMKQAPEIADISKRELEALMGYKRAVQNKSADADRLAKGYRDLADARKAAYAHFQKLIEVNR